jgi:glycosyltransferase involved in cell wall biosynthesis
VGRRPGRGLFFCPGSGYGHTLSISPKNRTEQRGPVVHPTFARKEQAETGRTPLRTVFLLQDLCFGGTQRHALELAARLDPDRFRVELWTLMAGDDFVPQAERAGLTVRRLCPGPAVGPRSLAALWRALRTHRPDMLVPLTVVPNIWGRVLGRLAGVPAVVGNCRGTGDPGLQHEWLLWPLADHVLCNAEAIKARLARTFRVPAGRVTVIRNGVNTEAFAPVPPDPDRDPVILCVARMAPVKDHATLIAAFGLLAPDHPRARLRLVGDGPIRDQVADLAAASPFSERIRIVPGDAGVRAHYAQATLFVLSSRHEGLPNVILEAMASGLPVVATDVGGVGEAVREGVTGRLVPAARPEALARAMSEVLADPGLRDRMGRAARALAGEEFSLQAMARRHEEAFAAAWGKRRRA